MVSVYNAHMQLTIKIKLLADAAQKAALLQTMAAFNLAANDAARAGFDNNVFSVPSIHKLVYFDLRERYGLTAQLAVRAIGKASACFRRDKTKCPHFKPRSAVVYDERIMRFKGLTAVSLASLDGRLAIPIVVGGYQAGKLQAAIKTGQADLVYIQGVFYLLVSITLPGSNKQETSSILGVDLGVASIAVDSEGNVYTGKDVEAYRIKTQRMRDELQACGTRSAKRHLRRIANKESNYRRTKNHQISRNIVDFAKARHSDIALENLKGIRDRTRFKKSQRARMAGWAFFQLRNFIGYKAEMAGLAVLLIDPRNTSRTCNECGHCDKANRKSQAEFECLSCGHLAHADLNAARNVRDKGYVSKPIVTNVDQRLLSVAS
jgi:IS605 OrfB family transposase